MKNIFFFIGNSFDFSICRVLDNTDDDTGLAGISNLASEPNPTGAAPNLAEDAPNQTRASNRIGADTALKVVTPNITGAALKPSVSKAIPNLKRVRAPLKENRKPLPSLARVSPAPNFEFSVRAVPNLTRITALNPASRGTRKITLGEIPKTTGASALHFEASNHPKTMAQKPELDYGHRPKR